MTELELEYLNNENHGMKPAMETLEVMRENPRWIIPRGKTDMKQVLSNKKRLNPVGPYQGHGGKELDWVQVQLGSQCRVLGNRVMLSLWLYWEKTLQIDMNGSQLFIC